jgi:hypothetical protein
VKKSGPWCPCNKLVFVIETSVWPFGAFMMKTLVIHVCYFLLSSHILCVPLDMWSDLNDLVFLRSAIASAA